MDIRATSKTDLETIRNWIELDPWHQGSDRCRADFLLSGAGGILAFCLEDEHGPVAFVRLDKDDKRVRLATQFAPENIVSKRRLVVGMARLGIPVALKFAKDKGYEGIVFESISPSLISFMARYNFKHDKDNDYLLKFEERQDG